MARKLDKILIIDLEATCWETDPPDNQENDIIEIGICPVSLPELNIEIIDDILVIPSRSKISKFCTNLTTLTQDMIDQNGIPFQDACKLLQSKYKSTRYTWASWGDYDRRQFERQCLACNVKYPFGPTHLNLKNWFAISIGLPKEVGMAEALELLGLELLGTHHRAGDDAYNIARIFKTLKTRK